MHKVVTAMCWLMFFLLFHTKCLINSLVAVLEGEIQANPNPGVTTIRTSNAIDAIATLSNHLWQTLQYSIQRFQPLC